MVKKPEKGLISTNFNMAYFFMKERSTYTQCKLSKATGKTNMGILHDESYKCEV